MVTGEKSTAGCSSGIDVRTGGWLGGGVAVLQTGVGGAGWVWVCALGERDVDHQGGSGGGGREE